MCPLGVTDSVPVALSAAEREALLGAHPSKGIQVVHQQHLEGTRREGTWPSMSKYGKVSVAGSRGNESFIW